MPLPKRNARIHKSNRNYSPRDTLLDVPEPSVVPPSPVDHDFNWDIGDIDFTSASDNRYVPCLIAQRLRSSFYARALCAV